MQEDPVIMIQNRLDNFQERLQVMSDLLKGGQQINEEFQQFYNDVYRIHIKLLELAANSC